MIRKFAFGKYKGMDIMDVIINHTGYILWLLENTNFKLNEIEQEMFDARATSIVNNQITYVYPKQNLRKYIKNKEIKSPFKALGDTGFWGIITSLKDTKLAKIAIKYINEVSKSEVRKFISKKRQKEYDRMLQIHKNILSFDDNREMGLSEEDYENCFTESSFLY